MPDPMIGEMSGMPNEGFFWHVHHRVLLEWCYNLKERLEYIRNCKDRSEIETRERLLKPVKGNLQEVTKAWQAHVEAGQAYDEARQAFDETRWACVKAARAYAEAERAWVEALDKHKPEIEALHAEECPNCPWNGHTIFPE